ncbi:uncharacterized protein LOC143276800 [Babylonia areolata]|uniref:uncharacterized protein LOC143276800 n=1 Tax=Babylonia areolata TaxID=304850 RepID=UPI003FCF13EF
MMTTCCAVLGLVLLVMTNLAAIIAFATPYWIKLGMRINRGLWAYCGPSVCTWVFQDTVYYMQEQDSAWWRVTQGFMCISLALTLFALLVATVALCCECKGCNSSAVVSGILFVAALVLGVAVTVFGICANYHLSVDLDSMRQFSWSFWLTIAASGLALVTGMVYALEGKTRNSYRNRC